MAYFWSRALRRCRDILLNLHEGRRGTLKYIHIYIFYVNFTHHRIGIDVEDGNRNLLIN